MAPCLLSPTRSRANGSGAPAAEARWPGPTEAGSGAEATILDSDLGRLGATPGSSATEPASSSWANLRYLRPALMPGW
ncbi:unnamed protein product [Coccothraustes coccothraustes]